MDLYRAFGVGDNAKSIGTVDDGGVALAAIQGLYRQNQALQRQSQAFQRQNQTLRAQLAAQNARLSRLEHAFSKLSL